jgi:citrate lyase beta subunit
VSVRVNGLTTPWTRDDLAACAWPGLANIVLPKTETARDLEIVDEALTGIDAYRTRVPGTHFDAGLGAVFDSSGDMVSSAPKLARLTLKHRRHPPRTGQRRRPPRLRRHIIGIASARPPVSSRTW